MALNYRQLKAITFDALRHRYDADDCILYALGVGAGLCDPAGSLGDEVEYLYEEKLQALPSMVSVIAYPGFWMREPEHGIDWRKVVHGEQRITLHRPLATTASVYSRSRVTRVTDKGTRSGAVVVTERTIFDEATHQQIARIEQVNVCRGDGGYSGGNSALSDPPLPPIPRPPERIADDTVIVPTSRSQAAIYRLTGDRNPLHIDPESARRAGLPAPILHGAALAGLVSRASMQRPQPDDAFLARLDIRFSGVAYPGESVTVERWHEAGAVAFRCCESATGRELAFGLARWKPLGTEYAE
ncbi:MaoC/PaaZ C-terminal domain-containing protein [Cupriavidus sp. L7L]|uniref:MaoC/PaaZ C-terminal domain-containing protein n=1 Tax=Cupriavidus sp. L7L TaxID=2546443 RepID=UPI0010559B12|nr:MaoC/PaaZ C-terminal domain-containing protein [Cupriavidus sp. L7L]TDF64506.1 3-alpha,7-alpha,12-alpha-trihydroxy-5-beta-cholest-24-enoyl-CoA hydratase [Cupriavidus sp. L7L]